jgi:predicted outer membrane repeat protein
MPGSLPHCARRLIRLALAVPAFVLLLSPLLSTTAIAQANIRYVNQKIADGLIAYWSFDENGGSAFRDSARLPAAGNGGVLLPGAAFFGSSDRAPLKGMYFNPSSLLLDGVNGLAQVKDAPVLNPGDAFTLGFWIKRLADDGPGVIYLSGSNPDAWQLSFDATGHLTFEAGPQVLASATTPLTVNQWHYVAVTRQGAGPASLRLWLDGVEVAAAAAGSLAATSGDKYIGGRPGSATTNWFGRLDEMSLYNRALSAAEINNLATGSTCATDGKSWATSFRWVTCAIADAPANTDIWIARGLYIPGILRDHTFNVRNNVHLTGGFVGNETSLSQRPPFVAPTGVVVDPAQYTVLNGDLLGNDDPTTLANYGDNSNHVVTGTGVALVTRLDGLVISGGNADKADARWAIGGGLLNQGGRLSLSNLAFVANKAAYGAGIAYQQSNLQLSNVLFLGNRALIAGGGLWADSSPVQLSDVHFRDNQAGDGGGLAIQNAPLSVAGAQFSNNTAERLGGAILTQSAPSVELTAVTLTGNRAGSGGGLAAQNSTVAGSQVQWQENHADSGGALYSLDSIVQINVSSLQANNARRGGAIAHQGGSLALTEVSFTGNQATEDAGALHNQDGGSVTINRANFRANRSGAAGGAILNSGATTVSIVNSDFVGNSAVHGGALHTLNANFALINATISANASSGGAIVSAAGSSSGSVSNTLIWGNSGAAFEAAAPSAVTLNRNLIEGQGGSDPLFVRLANSGDGDWSTLDNNDYGELSVQIASPTIDAGDNAALPVGIATDVKGSGRFWDHLGTPDTGAGIAPLVDIGAHEFVTALPFARANGPYSGAEGAPIAVDASGSGAQIGSIVAYEWDCDADGLFEVTSPTTTAACTFVDNGAYTVRLRVTAAGDTGETAGSADATALVVVKNAPPVYTPPLSQVATTGKEVMFDLGAFADAGAADTWQVVIDWGDASKLDALDVGRQGRLQRSHIFAAAGQYTVTLRVTDDDGDNTSGVFRVDAGSASDDADGDGLSNQQECGGTVGCPDTDGDGIPNYLDNDDDGDGLLTVDEAKSDSDGDGLADYLDNDDDGDGVLTQNEQGGDLDGDGLPDYLDPDDDGDGIPTKHELGDANRNGVDDHREFTYRVLLSLIRR